MSQFQANIKAHNRVAKLYKSRHTEIYNSVEQDRLKAEISNIVKSKENSVAKLTVLDLGSGDGNLTDIFVSLGCHVISADVSEHLLNRISNRHDPMDVRTLLIEEENVIELPDNTIDIVGIYSVLHHIPNYLGIFEELHRILKPNGIVYLDHENSASFWDYSESQRKKYNEFRARESKPLSRFFNIYNYIDAFIRAFIDNKYQREGDIHVWDDDHIEWEKVRYETSNWAEVERYEEYCLFRGGYDYEDYLKHKDEFCDIALMIIKKKEG